ncbi:hypothetical protein SAMN05892883_1744 [Jatrophihabitans sp. GAS493]|uniref:hypothetical protein n=1 Tax=Jatrophihabitans sp. GAS493 TaxID=1907575 RepID=UPI000BB6FE68|nr:hypothetical protein [Jatrophihabitans sp. GAS493]SOD72345.1 hypothetical protein SAMN05892883_1744 [Jatrophihabitans sp. GAS493]
MNAQPKPAGGRADAASWLLAAVGAAVAPTRREWGEAMRAELDSIDEPGERRRFARSCVKVIVSDWTTLRSVLGSLLVLAAVVVGLVLAGTVRYLPLRLEGVVLVLLLASVSVVARRTRSRAWLPPFGPVADAPAGRVLRAGGYATIGVLMLFMLADLRFAQRQQHPTPPDAISALAFGIAALLLVGVAVTVALATSQRSPFDATGLAVVGLLSAGAGLVWYVVILLQSYVDTGLLAVAALLVAALVGVAAMTLTAWSGAPSATSLLAGLCAAVFASLLIFTAPQATYALFPGSVPDPSPGSYWPQLDPAGHQEQDRVEASDPYVGLVLVGGVLTLVACGLLGAMTRRPVGGPDRPELEPASQ